MGLRVRNQNHPMFTRVFTGLRLQTPKRVGMPAIILIIILNRNLSRFSSNLLAPASRLAGCLGEPLERRPSISPAFQGLSRDFKRFQEIILPPEPPKHPNTRVGTTST